MHGRAPTGGCRRRSWAAAAALLLVVLGFLLPPAALLGATPTLLLALALAAGWMPGEAAIARLRSRRERARPRRRPALLGTPPAVPARVHSRIGICFSLANRPPPVRLLHP